MIEKAGDIEANANLQSPSKARKIDSRYPRDYRPLIKKNKDKAN